MKNVLISVYIVLILHKTVQNAQTYVLDQKTDNVIKIANLYNYCNLIIIALSNVPISILIKVTCVYNVIELVDLAMVIHPSTVYHVKIIEY